MSSTAPRAASPAATSSMSAHMRDLNRASFEGVMISALAYGALIMLYIQISQVMLRRPKRSGRTFWFIVLYASALFPLTTVAFAGKFKFTEDMFLALPDFLGGPIEYTLAHAADRSNVMSQICTTLVPWFGDILMLYRLMVVWNYRWSLLIVPTMIYLTRVGLSIPLLIAQTQPHSSQPAELYGRIFYALCLSLNIICTSLICIRLHTMRHKAERVLGNLQASLYNSATTMFVESGAFFTLWSMVYVITRSRSSWVQSVFLEPYSYIIALTRMLIILRMAQDRAWSKDIINAADTGVLDWEVSSMNSVALNNGMAAGHGNLPKMFQVQEKSSFNSSSSSSHSSVVPRGKA
jgi:nitrate reductase NapE component